MNYESEICRGMDSLADGDEVRAEQIFNNCIASIKKHNILGKSTPEEFYYWGMCLALQEEPEQALLKFEKAVQLQPDYEEALWQIVHILFYTKQSAESALSLLEGKLLKMNPTKKEYLEVRLDIQSYLKHSPEIKQNGAELK